MLWSLLFAAAFYISTALFLLFGSWLFLAPRSWAMKGLALHGRFSVWLLRVLCGTRMEVRNSERLPKGAALIVAKHQSAWDTFALVPLFPDPAIVLKHELTYIPFYGWFCIKFQHILVRRDRAAVALKRLVADARDKASEGRQVVIFAEGTRRPPGAEPDYKPGYVALYEGLGIPCVPIALNSGLFWPRRSLMRFPGTIVVEVLEPIPPGLARAEFRRLLESRIEAASAALVREAALPDAPPTVADALSRLDTRAGLNAEL